jgi:DNA polymerase IV (archaeal DinB-like DNA polymerase)
MAGRIIGHIDMDAFFAAIEECDHPELRALPIVVGADPRDGRGRGVVSTANYRARAYGIHSAMPISQAWQRSEAARRRQNPAVVFVRPNFERYSEGSNRIRAILEKHVSSIESASIDEMYFDLSFSGSFEKATEVCQTIKDEIEKTEHLTASVGIGSNKLISKIASDFRKPNGLTVIHEKDVETFLAPLSVRKIPGIGPKSEALLKQRGIETIRDLRRYAPGQLLEWFGKWGSELYEKIRGRDNSPIHEIHEVKSIGAQETFAEDTKESKFIIDQMNVMCRNVMRRLIKEGFINFKAVVVTIRFSDFETKSRSHTLAHPAGSEKALSFEAMKLILPFLDHRHNPKLKLIRMIGVRIEKLGRS